MIHAGHVAKVLLLQFCFTFDAVIATLSEVTNGKDASKATEARGILPQVQSSQFLLCLIFLIGF